MYIQAHNVITEDLYLFPVQSHVLCVRCLLVQGLIPVDMLLPARNVLAEQNAAQFAGSVTKYICIYMYMCMQRTRCTYIHVCTYMYVHCIYMYVYIVHTVYI